MVSIRKAKFVQHFTCVTLLLVFHLSYSVEVFYLFGSSLLLSSMLCSPITTDIVFGLTNCKTTDKKVV